MSPGPSSGKKAPVLVFCCLVGPFLCHGAPVCQSVNEKIGFEFHCSLLRRVTAGTNHGCAERHYGVLTPATSSDLASNGEIIDTFCSCFTNGRC